MNNCSRFWDLTCDAIYGIRLFSCFIVLKRNLRNSIYPCEELSNESSPWNAYSLHEWSPLCSTGVDKDLSKFADCPLRPVWVASKRRRLSTLWDVVFGPQKQVLRISFISFDQALSHKELSCPTGFLMYTQLRWCFNLKRKHVHLDKHPLLLMLHN